MPSITRRAPDEADRPRPLTPADVTVVDEPLLRRAVAAAALGNAMEWFDFGIFAYLAVTISQVFLPQGDPAANLVATFGFFAAAFVVRPIGGAVFGRLGDRIGRQRVLATTMLLMAAGTLAIGLIPAYAQIGGWAPVLLLLARFLQGFSTGGEYGGAATFIAEFAPDRRRGFLGSWLEFGTLGGYVLGATVVTVLRAVLPEADLVAWGWRIPFLVAGPLGLVGLYLRLRLEETPAFRRHQVADLDRRGGRDPERTSVSDVLAAHWRALLVCVGLVLVFNVTDYMLLSYMPTYLAADLGTDPATGLVMIILVMVLMMAMMPFGGRLSDRFGRRPVLLAGCIGLLVLALPALRLVQSDDRVLVFLGLFLLGLVLVTFASTMPATLPALFPTAIRYGALAIAFNVSVSLFGGTTPLLTEALITAARNAGLPWAADIPAYVLMAAALVGVVAVAGTTETANRPLLGSGPTVGSADEVDAVVRAFADPRSSLARSAWARDFAGRHPSEQR